VLLAQLNRRPTKAVPIHRDLDGIPWCDQAVSGYAPDQTAQWDWASDKTTIIVAVTQTGTVTITRHADDEGRQGYDQ
jgi:hypothetical protein